MEFIRQFLPNNEVAEALIIMYIITMFGFICRRIPSLIWAWFERHMTYTFTTTDHVSRIDDRVYERINIDYLRPLARTKFKRMQVSSLAYDGGGSPEKLLDSTLIPDNETVYAKLGGVWCRIAFSKNMSEQLRPDHYGRLKNNILRISTLIWNRPVLEAMVLRALPEEKTDDVMLGVWKGNGWEHLGELTVAMMKSYVLPKHVADVVLPRLNFFIDNPDWYRDRGRAHRLNILLHGTYGTGKTKFVYYLASRLGWRIIRVPLNSLTNDQMEGLVVQRRTIFLLDEVDTLSSTASRVKSNDETSTDLVVAPPVMGITLDILNGVFDGLVKNTETIFVLTTNHLDKLDPSIYRDQRMDIVVEVGAFEPCDIYQYIACNYPGDDYDRSRIEKIHGLVGSKISKIGDQNPYSVSDFIAGLEKEVAKL